MKSIYAKIIMKRFGAPQISLMPTRYKYRNKITFLLAVMCADIVLLIVMKHNMYKNIKIIDHNIE